MLWIIYAESSNYCGYGDHWVVKADSAYEAEIRASDDIESYWREQDEAQYEDESGDPDETTFSAVISVEVLDEAHEHWGWYNDPGQYDCYHRVNFSVCSRWFSLIQYYL